MVQIYINNSGGKRKIKDTKHSKEIIKKVLLENIKEIPIYYKKWFKKTDILNKLKNYNIIADIWALNDFIFSINNRKEGIEPLELYIENSSRLIRLVGNNFILTEEEKLWEVVTLDAEYYCFLDKKILNELDKTTVFNINFKNGGIELYSPYILADKKKEKLKEDLVIVRINLNELDKRGIDIFSNDKMRNVLLVDCINKESFSEVLL